MNLRSGLAVGAGILPAQCRPQFEEGVQLILSKWTALELAVEQEWGGRQSGDKAENMLDELLEWFDRKRGMPSLSPRASLSPLHAAGTVSTNPCACDALVQNLQTLSSLTPLHRTGHLINVKLIGLHRAAEDTKHLFHLC